MKKMVICKTRKILTLPLEASDDSANLDIDDTPPTDLSIGSFDDDTSDVLVPKSQHGDQRTFCLVVLTGR